MSKARLTRDEASGMNGSARMVKAGTVVRTAVDMPSLEGDSPIPPSTGTMRVGLTDDGDYVILTSENCEAVE